MTVDRRAMMINAIAAAGLAATSRAAATQAEPLPATAVLPPEDALPPDPARQGLVWPAPSHVVPLWDGPSPGAHNPAMRETVAQEATDPTIHFRWVNGITRPRMSIFPATNPNGAAMLIIPGGGFVRNYFDHEGYLLADFLAKQGILSAVLFYRLAQDGWDRPADVGVIDAQRAIRVLRALARARAMPIDPRRIGVIGFSAGGFLAASLQTRYGQSIAPPTDAIDSIDARPMLAGLIYPVQSLDRDIAYHDLSRVLFGGAPLTPELAQVHAPDRAVTAQTPPGFFVHCADDDGVSPANSTRLADALTARGVAAETHVFASGGHGFGYTRDTCKPVHVWPEMFVNFARTQGLIG